MKQFNPQQLLLRMKALATLLRQIWQTCVWHLAFMSTAFSFGLVTCSNAELGLFEDRLIFIKFLFNLFIILFPLSCHGECNTETVSIVSSNHWNTLQNFWWWWILQNWSIFNWLSLKLAHFLMHKNKYNM